MIPLPEHFTENQRLQWDLHRLFTNRSGSGLGQMFVAAIAVWRFGGVLALASPESGFLGDLDFHRLQAGALVGAVAKWCVGRAPAGAPEMGAGFDFERKRPGIANDWFFGHGWSVGKN